MSRTTRDHSWSKRWFAGIGVSGRDQKPGAKPPSWFKKIRRRLRRHRIKMAIRNSKELPVEKRNDVWEWN